MESVLIYKDGGEVREVGRKSTSGALVMVNGIVHTYDSEVMDEPYLKEWGWLCCSEQEREIYRWLYRCMLEGLSVPKRTVEVGGAAEFEFVTDGKKSGTDEITGDMIARLAVAGEHIVSKVMADDFATFMRIPVVQFQISDESIFYTICQRVMMDNPLLMFPFYPSMPDSVAVIKNEMGDCHYLYSVVPTMEKCAQAREICNEQIGKIVQKIDELYGIRPGDVLTVAQKAKVLKVIHDGLILIGNLEDGMTTEWWLYTPYAVYDRRYKGLCTSYTMAFCAVARMYGIEAVNMTGFAYINKDNSADGSYELTGEHSWVAVRLSDGEYGTYPADPALWSCIDVYWDEPLHESVLGNVSAREDVIWKYFLNMPEINILSEDEEKTGHSYRTVDANIAYGALPVAAPSLSMPYDGDEIYTWEDET